MRRSFADYATKFVEWRLSEVVAHSVLDLLGKSIVKSEFENSRIDHLLVKLVQTLVESVYRGLHDN